jgi:hypothetical protein
MIEPRPEERNHIGVGEVMQTVRVGDAEVFCLVRKRTRSLLWTSEVEPGRAAGLPVTNKGSFLGWVDNDKITFLPIAP